MAHQVKKNLGAMLRRDGATFRVWAPFAKSVAVACPYVYYDTSNQVAMTSEGDGYWSTHIAGAEAGQTYKYLITTPNDEIVLRNDPRARALTSTENGDGIIVANTFDWGDDIFMPIPREQQIMYEMHIGTFNRPDPATQGTFDDAIEKLDYLQDLGINMIELMPVTTIAYSQGWGYNVRDLFAIEGSYGGRHGLMKFVRACHDRGIGVIIDVVYNHFLSTNLWQFDGWDNENKGGIYFYDDERGETPYGARPDYGRPEVRQFILDNIVMWFSEFRVDGLRLDSTAYMRSKAGNEDRTQEIADAWTLMSDITTLAHKLRPGSIMIAEDTSSNEFMTKPVIDGGCGFDSQWGLPFPNAIRHSFGLDAPYYADIIEQLQFRYNNDAFDRIIFSDSHDTAANGHERLNTETSPDDAGSLRARQRTLIASTLALTAPGIPMLLQGQEFMQEGDFNDWQELEWDKTKRFDGIVQAHRDLIHLRLDTHAVTAGLGGQHLAVFHNNPTNNVIGYHRWKNGGTRDDVIVIVNFGNESFAEYDVVLPVNGQWKVRFNSLNSLYADDFHSAGIDAVQSDESGRVTLPLSSHQVLILSQD